MLSPKILCFDTTLDVCSVAVTGKGNETVSKAEQGVNIHSARLNMLIASAMEDAGLEFRDLDAICVCKGPGSFTGLRIGVSAAKGLCYALDKPLMSQNSLQIMARVAKDMVTEPKSNVLFCPMIDARRMEVYSALFDTEAAFVTTTAAAVVDADFLKEVLDSHQVYFFGNGMAKCRYILENHSNAHFIDAAVYPLADYMAREAINLFNARNFEDLFTFEPFYLKDFYTNAKV